MNRSLTPTGVEHRSFGAWKRPDEQVNRSLTPTGVEHVRFLSSLSLVWVVNRSLTPTGVEHDRFLGRDGEGDSCEPIFDADRR